MSKELYLLLAVAIMTAITAALRFLPFVVFKDPTHAKAAKHLEYLGETLPFALMVMLVVYCLREVNFTDMINWVPALLASIATVGLYAWRRSTLLAILGGTVSYMVLVQAVF